MSSARSMKLLKENGRKSKAKAAAASSISTHQTTASPPIAIRLTAASPQPSPIPIEAAINRILFESHGELHFGSGGCAAVAAYMYRPSNTRENASASQSINYTGSSATPHEPTPASRILSTGEARYSARSRRRLPGIAHRAAHQNAMRRHKHETAGSHRLSLRDADGIAFTIR